MNTTTNTTHADRIFAPGRYFAPAARYYAPAARYFAPEAGLTESMPCSAFPARMAGPAPGPARPGVGWLRRP
jgi:hypothetical protein